MRQTVKKRFVHNWPHKYTLKMKTIHLTMKTVLKLLFTVMQALNKKTERTMKQQYLSAHRRVCI
jgi:hypothetical protein